MVVELPCSLITELEFGSLESLWLLLADKFKWKIEEPGESSNEAAALQFLLRNSSELFLYGPLPV